MKRPVLVTIIAGIYLVVGVGGLVGHFSALLTDTTRFDGFWIELTELAAVVSGVFLLLRQNWARWLALAWIAFHVVLSFDAPLELAIHLAFCVFIGWALFRPASGAWFVRNSGTGDEIPRKTIR